MSTMDVLQIKTNCTGGFVFAADGEPAIVAEIHDAHGEIADFVAWQPEQQGRWWLRRGDIAVLGGHALAVAAYHGDKIRLWPTPQDWFRTRQLGVCILLWDAPLDGLFEGVGGVECDSPELQQRFLAALRQWEPRVVVRRGVHHDA